MARSMILGLGVAATVVVWGVFFFDVESLVSGAKWIKSLEARTLIMATVAAVVLLLGVVVGPRIAKGASSDSGGRQNSPEAPPEEPAIVTPKRAGDRKVQIQELLERDAANVLANGIEVRHLMSEHIETVHPDTKLADIKRIMADKGIRHLAVSKPGEYGHLSGIISDRDVASRRGGYARDIMTPSPVTVCHGAKIQHAVDVMADRGISCLPVTRGELVCGIITTTDMMIGLRATYEMLRLLVPEEQMATVAVGEA